MVLGNVFGYTVKDASPGKHAEHGNQLAEICRQPSPAGPNDTASNLPTSNPAPILTSVLAAVHKDAFANDISGEVVQQSRNYRTLIDGRQVVEQRQAQQALALFGGVAIFTVELTKAFPRSNRAAECNGTPP